jgi:hypothetical protein
VKPIASATSRVGLLAPSLGPSAILWYVMFAVLVAVIVGGTFWYLKRTVRKALEKPTAAQVAAAAASAWDGKTPLSCTGSQELTIEGVTATLEGTAVTATGSCKLKLVNVNLTGATAIEAGGAAVVTVQGGSLTGTTFSVHAAGAAHVDVSGAKVTGKSQAAGAAKITGI